MGGIRIRDVRTDGLTNGRTTRRIYAPPSIKKIHIYIGVTWSEVNIK
jgi:hypothetical protein